MYVSKLHKCCKKFFINQKRIVLVKFVENTRKLHYNNKQIISLFFTYINKIILKIFNYLLGINYVSNF